MAIARGALPRAATRHRALCRCRLSHRELKPRPAVAALSHAQIRAAATDYTYVLYNGQTFLLVRNG
jgi:hypothetical protein